MQCGGILKGPTAHYPLQLQPGGVLKGANLLQYGGGLKRGTAHCTPTARRRIEGYNCPWSSGEGYYCPVQATVLSKLQHV